MKTNSWLIFKRRFLVVFFLLILPITWLISCDQGKKTDTTETTSADDIRMVENMIHNREEAMKKKNLAMAMNQFDDSATWINSQGYYFEGKEHVEAFHHMLLGNDSLDYYYEAGKPKIRLLDRDNALAYYSWKMFWYRKKDQRDTVIREIGLMTLHAQRLAGDWKWVAVTNQHTPWFYENISAVTAE